METYKKFKIEQSALKLYIFASGVGLTIYCGLLCLEVRHCIAEMLALIFAYILLSGAVWMFQLCKLSWVFLGYTFLVRVCMILHDTGFFGDYEDMAHYVVFGIGAAISGYFFVNFKKYV